MDISDSLFQEIVRRIVSVSDPDRIIVFGSAARGELTPDSDIDLLVLQSSAPDVMRQRVRLRESLRGLGVPFDVIVMSTERFEESKSVIGGIAYPAHKYGRVIYEAA